MKSSVTAALKHLRKVDPVMHHLIKKHGPCTLFDENSLINQSKFHVLAWAIINQQLSVKSARSIEKKLLARLSKQAFEPDGIVSLSDTELAACGLSHQKIRYLRTLGNAVQKEQLNLDQLTDKSTEVISEILEALPGIGPWTVDMFLIFSLGRLDVLPLGDLALRKSLAMHYQLPNNASLQEYEAIAENWRPYQTVASWYLWLAVD